MLDPESILRLYANVLHNDIVVNAVSTQGIRESVRSMAQVYAADDSAFESNVLKFLNFNDVACRCAYLHKYAPLHTYIASDAMLKVFQRELSVFRDLVAGDGALFRLCSLGGGPGSDVLGVLSALRVVFNTTLRASVSIVDCMEKWESTFESVMKELKFGGYGQDWYYFASGLKWNYIGANLLCKMSNEVNTAVGSADLITMVKFISASVCTNTEAMVDKIFRVMKVGALVLYIDNAAGGFTELIERSSRRNGLVPVVGPLRHVRYDAQALKIDRFGYSSCFQTTVTIALLRKAQRAAGNNRRKGELPCDPNRLLETNRRSRPARESRNKKLDFVVFDHLRDDRSYGQTRLDPNLLSPELNNATGTGKCPEKLVNNLAKSSNLAKSADIGMSPRKSNPVSPARSQPVSRAPASQRYRPLSPAGNDAGPPRELDDDSEEACCSCCVVS